MIYVVGIGPGEYEQMTIAANNALSKCDVIVGYEVYTRLAMDHFPDKEYLTTPMKKEIDRCQMAFAEAKKGKEVAMICSGDAGIYGMASPILEIGKNYPDVEVKVVSGVTAAISGAAVLGAPISHDFCVISLSDLLTPWEVIEKRIIASAQGDFVTAIYNPSSKKRHDYLKKACEIMLSYKSRDTVCAVVWNIGRKGEKSQITTLSELLTMEVNMFSTVFIGNSKTKKIGDKMVTPRGYEI